MSPKDNLGVLFGLWGKSKVLEYALIKVKGNGVLTSSIGQELSFEFQFLNAFPQRVAYLKDSHIVHVAEFHFSVSQA